MITEDVTKLKDLKQAVIRHLKANIHELIERARSAMELGDKRLSQLVNEVKRRFLMIGLKDDDKIIKSRLLQHYKPACVLLW